ncbi:PLP-dependent aminotransferase family protein [Streptomyces sp. NPDC058086]|uniref:aminotransferase-like domain-containing protein n=1 Tax=Streptomyces sp. NPDC058086 TaxID=3346334 RepID=UPI0036E6AED8
MSDISILELHESLRDPVMLSMNLLNEIASEHPDAISFAAGRPLEDIFRTEFLHEYLDTFTTHLTENRAHSTEEIRRTLYQYGRTKGIVHDLVAEYLRIDEGIEIDPEAIVMTVGCQEAMFLVLRALRVDERDVVLAVAPTYFGLNGAARLLDMPVVNVDSGHLGIDLDHLKQQIRRTRDVGLRPRALYLLPDFSNPTGLSLSLGTRNRLLEIARREGIFLLEDNPYGLFRADGGARVPSLKALDTDRTVIHLGSFSKTGLPGARVGFVVADQRVAVDGHRVSLLSDQLSLLKSNVTLNTSPIAQALIGGKLLQNGCSMLRANQREIQIYGDNLRRVLRNLEQRFPADSGVSWNSPAGGFFVIVTVPFTVNDKSLERSAREHGVIWTPMHHFYEGLSSSQQIRLSFSLLTSERIDEGMERLASFVSCENRSHIEPPA